jgi:hypothetical protein
MEFRRSLYPAARTTGRIARSWWLLFAFHMWTSLKHFLIIFYSAAVTSILFREKDKNL